MNSPCSLGIREVEYRPVSHRERCVWCVNDATQEAFRRNGNLTAVSRCCDNPKCVWLSAEMCERTVGTA